MIQDLSYLDDSAARDAILRIADESALCIKPQEAPMARDIAEEYLEEVREAGRLLYLRPGRGRGMGFDGASGLWLLVALPVIVGCLGNLMAEAGVRAFEALCERGARSSALLSPARIRPALDAHARLAGLTQADVERLSAIVSGVLIALATEGDANSRP
jgi:hypothetical protein